MKGEDRTGAVGAPGVASPLQMGRLVHFAGPGLAWHPSSSPSLRALLSGVSVPGAADALTSLALSFDCRTSINPALGASLANLQTSRAFSRVLCRAASPVGSGGGLGCSMLQMHQAVCREHESSISLPKKLHLQLGERLDIPELVTHARRPSFIAASMTAGLPVR